MRDDSQVVMYRKSGIGMFGFSWLIAYAHCTAWWMLKFEACQLFFMGFLCYLPETIPWFKDGVIYTMNGLWSLYASRHVRFECYHISGKPQTCGKSELEQSLAASDSRLLAVARNWAWPMGLSGPWRPEWGETPSLQIILLKKTSNVLMHIPCTPIQLLDAQDWSSSHGEISNRIARDELFRSGEVESSESRTQLLRMTGEISGAPPQHSFHHTESGEGTACPLRQQHSMALPGHWGRRLNFHRFHGFIEGTDVLCLSGALAMTETTGNLERRGRILKPRALSSLQEIRSRANIRWDVRSAGTMNFSSVTCSAPTSWRTCFRHVRRLPRQPLWLAKARDPENEAQYYTFRLQ